MNKLLSVVLLLCLLISCVSCAGTPGEDTTPAATTPAKTTPASTTPAPNQSMGMPPQELRFYSLEELRELKAMMERNDDADREALRNNANYFWNGLTGIADIEKLFDKFGNFHFYYLDPSSGYTFAEISYRPQPNGTHHVAESDLLVIEFRNETGYVSLYYGFNREPRPEPDYLVVGYVTLRDRPVKLYDPQGKRPLFYIPADTEEYNFEICFVRCNVEAIEPLINEHLVYATLYELMEMY